MSKEAMKLALEALENSRSLEPVDVQWVKGKRHAAITALREALAEQPAQQEFVSPGGGYVPAIPAQQRPIKTFHDGKAWPVQEPAQQDSTCNNALRIQGKAYPRTCKKCGLGPCISESVKPAQQEPVQNNPLDCGVYLGSGKDHVIKHHVSYGPAQQEPVAWKLVPREPTHEMLKAMDECSTEGYDERLYAGHAASVYMAAVDAAPTPPAQPQQEPVVWMYVNKSTHETKFQKHMRDFVDHSLWSEVPLYGEPLANHEFQCVCGAVWCGDEMVHLPDKRPPAQRKPLTDEEIILIVADCASSHQHTDIHFARAIEAKLKEKNNG